MADFRRFCNFLEHRDCAASRVALLTNGMVATTSLRPTNVAQVRMLGPFQSQT
jgi:hypothetical protein